MHLRGLIPYAPVKVFQGDADEEVSPRRCQELVDKSRKRGANIEITFYPGATHNFDDPGRKRQKVDANASAREDVLVRAKTFFANTLHESSTSPGK
jgi:dienelactone hydrolase